MNTIQIALSDREIADQKKYAEKYFALIQKELNYKDLCDLANLQHYTKSYKAHCELAKTGFITMNVPE